MSEMEITGEQLRVLSEQSVAFYLALDRTSEQIAAIYHAPVARVEKIALRIGKTREREEARAQARLRQALGGRPFPPDELLDRPGGFAPAAALLNWARETFLSDDGPLYNPDHDHLAYADIAFLWTSAPYKKQGRLVAGLCEMPSVQGNAWTRARMDAQLTEWFEAVPKFLITLSAPISASLDDASFCALVEHEMYHVGQAEDEFGGAKFNNDTGEPMLCLKGHDVEEHIGVVQRYGPGAAAAGVTALVQAASRPPSVAAVSIAQACGTCLK